MANFFVRCVFIFFVLFNFRMSNCYKILIVAPTLTGSQVMFNMRVADLLAEHRNNVTILLLKCNREALKTAQSKENVQLKLATMIADEDIDKYHKTISRVSGTAFKDPEFNAYKMHLLINEFQQFMLHGCKRLVNDVELIKDLQSEDFDVAITYMYDLCGFGLLHLAHVSTYAWMSSGVLLEYMAWAVGVPWPASYVPSQMGAVSDTMTYTERATNIFTMAMIHYMTQRNTINPTQEMLVEQFGPDFPDVYEMARRTPLVLVNSEELLDFPRPILHKTVYIGGIGMSQPKNDIQQPFRSVLATSENGVVLVSFGSWAKSSQIPESWKRALIETFRNFSQVTFLWKYDGSDSDQILHGLPNVITHHWLPQIDLLHKPQIKAFITHGGQNSILEAARAGVPLVVIPLFYDQFRNSRAAERHGMAVTVTKQDMAQPHHLSEALAHILLQPTYTENAQRLSRMISKKPVKAEKLLVRWVEFLAEFKTLDNLAIAGNDLTLIQYFSIDVILPLLTLLLLLTVIFIYVFYRILRCYYWSCFKMAYKEKQKIN